MKPQVANHLCICTAILSACSGYHPAPRPSPPMPPSSRTLVSELQREIRELDGSFVVQMAAGQGRIGDIEWDTPSPFTINVTRTGNETIYTFSPPLDIDIAGYRQARSHLSQLSFRGERIFAYQMKLGRLAELLRRRDVIVDALSSAFAPSSPAALLQGSPFALAVSPANSLHRITTTSAVVRFDVLHLTYGSSLITLIHDNILPASLQMDLNPNTRDVTMSVGATALVVDGVLDINGLKLSLHAFSLTAPTINANEGPGRAPSLSIRANSSRTTALSLDLNLESKASNVIVHGTSDVHADETSIALGTQPTFSLKAATMAHLGDITLKDRRSIMTLHGPLALEGNVSFVADPKVSCECKLVGGPLTGEIAWTFDDGTQMRLVHIAIDSFLSEWHPDKSHTFIPALQADADLPDGLLHFGKAMSLPANVASIKATNISIDSESGMSGELAFHGYTSPGHEPQTEMTAEVGLSGSGLIHHSSSSHHRYRVSGDNHLSTILEVSIVRRPAPIITVSIDPMEFDRHFDEGLKLVPSEAAASLGGCKKSDARYYTFIFDVRVTTDKVKLLNRAISGSDPLTIDIPTHFEISIPGGHGQYVNRDDPSQGNRTDGSRPWRDYQEVFSDTITVGKDCTYHKYIAPQKADTNGILRVSLDHFAGTIGTPRVQMSGPKDLGLPNLNVFDDDQQNGCWGRLGGREGLEICGALYIYRHMGSQASSWQPNVQLEYISNAP